MNPQTEQACHDLIAEQGKVIAELEAERDKFKAFYLNSNEERAKLIVRLTNHVPVSDILRKNRERIIELETALRQCFGTLEQFHNDNFIVLGEETLAKFRALLP